MHFHDIRFPSKLSLGSSGGPQRKTEIVTLKNGFEERNSPWAQSRHSYDAGLAVHSADDLHEIVSFFEARHGQLYGFRWKDWTDFKSCTPSRLPEPDDQHLGLGDGLTTDFQLIKTYRSGDATYTRKITRPVAHSVLVSVGGTIQTEGVDYTLDLQTGILSFATPPSETAPVMAGYEFDVPVRFDTDHLSITARSFEAGAIPDIPVVEIRE